MTVVGRGHRETRDRPSMALSETDVRVLVHHGPLSDGKPPSGLDTERPVHPISDVDRSGLTSSHTGSGPDSGPKRGTLKRMREGTESDGGKRPDDGLRVHKGP